MKRRDFIKSTMVMAAGATAGLSAFSIFDRTLRSAVSYGEAHAAETLKVYSVAEGRSVMTEKVVKSIDEWRRQLSPEQFHVLREQGTERAFTGIYDKHYQDGVYQCAGCNLDLYGSADKFNSGTGWPSFTRPVAEENVATRDDVSFFMRRTELLCARCDGHLGHVFDDGPPPTGMRHCINSASLTFVASK